MDIPLADILYITAIWCAIVVAVGLSISGVVTWVRRRAHHNPMNKEVTS
jgi:hypothetical protein